MAAAAIPTGEIPPTSDFSRYLLLSSTGVAIHYLASLAHARVQGLHAASFALALVLWVPGRAPGMVDRLTSHLDLPATVLTLLGVENSPEDYSLGFDLLGPFVRDHVVVSDWNDVERVDAEGKIRMSMKNYDFIPEVTTRADAPLQDPKAFLDRRRPAPVEMLRSLGRFRQ